MAKIGIRCASCGGENVMRDASAAWDDHSQSWTLGSVYDAAYCDTCEADAALIEVPLVSGDDAPAATPG